MRSKMSSPRLVRAALGESPVVLPDARGWVAEMSSQTNNRRAGAPDVVLTEPAFWRRADLDQVFATLRRENPVSWQPEPQTTWSNSGRGYWAIVRHANVKNVSRSPSTFISGQGTELFDLPTDVARAYSGMLNMDPPEHTAMRSIVRDAFSPRRIASIRSSVNTRAEEILNEVCDRGACDFATEVADRLPTAVICDLVGIPEADRAWVARLSRATHPFGDGSFDDAMSAVKELIAYGRQLILTRRANPTDDLATVLAFADVGGQPLADDGAGTFFELLVTAGIETTGAAISHGMVALDAHRDEFERWRRDFERLAPTAIEEILRWSTPVVHFRRTAAVDTEIEGQAIAAGDKVVVFYNSANRDDRAFDSPNSFRVGRSRNPHVTFGGGGPHFCLGAHLARLEIRSMFERLFERLPDIEIAEPPKLTHSMFFNGVESLLCAFTPRRPVRQPAQ